MPSCLIIGDSIALGLALASNAGCDVRAKVGRDPLAILLATPPAPRCYRTAIISAGTNNPARLPLITYISSIRYRVCAEQIIWVLPVNPLASLPVATVASAGQDATVSFKPGRDWLHPQSYHALWRSVQKEIRR